MGNPYRLEKTDLDHFWDDFVNTSPNGSIFSLADYMKSIDQKCVAYYCYKNKEIRAGVSLVESDDGRSTELHDFIIYNGVMFCPQANKQNRAQINSERHRLVEFISEDLGRRYQNVSMSLDPSVIDIRAFLWYNYGTNLPKYEHNVRYTSYISLEGFQGHAKPEKVPLFMQCSSARRQEISYAIKKGVFTKEEFQPKLFVDFYNMTMTRQGIVVERSVLVGMRKLMETLFKKKMAKMFVSYTQHGNPGSMTFWGIDNKRAYFIFAANDPKYRNSHTGSAVIWDSFAKLNQSGVREVDLEGVNSPKRGWFKLSFGGDIRPYYHLIKVEN